MNLANNIQPFLSTDIPHRVTEIIFRAYNSIYHTNFCSINVGIFFGDHLVDIKITPNLDDEADVYDLYTIVKDNLYKLTENNWPNITIKINSPNIFIHIDY